ncbi:4-alpha-glucanotransferase [Hydrogenovibrio sp. 3SP14C1]|uniref:4-alpha-glucanotransferase n=1 Tax=Hydrogenovibrio sp. 3SP14C1 TaxID=3038774 RepID=UPI0024165B85|nr:4-alpha-glucanotransferase [Hydrogenovibrio sp. 3SP14C1]MDG4811746.1 4-alpha-glucanotransferase [Hydrogenovibrio sp. 3SP14C1]
MSDKKAGVLLHPSSLPSGKLDEQAWRFLDWMVQANLSIWQMLPLTHPVQGLSPYQSVSAFAMNPALLPGNWLEMMNEADFHAFEQDPPHWLNDYVLFMSLRQHFKMTSWETWPEAYRYRDFDALSVFSETHADEIQFLKKQQFVLNQIWQSLKDSAHEKGISLFGDMPIFVAYDSVDVWANPHLFKLDENLNPTVVTGVPPDYFSETGQRWGNPHYDWQEMQKDGFQWWHHRIQSDLSLFDLIRIDHFRGLESSWEIAVEEPTAVNGQWVKVPGELFLDSLQQAFPKLPLVAEDLGIITPEVTALKDRYHLPGMSVLQFGFNGLPDNPHALSEQVENSVVYTGTHDNDTSLGWWESLEDNEYKDWVLSQLPHPEEPMPWPLIEAAFQSVANLAMVPMQDFLSLGNLDRMNTPGTVENNWTWQFKWDQVTPEITEKIAGLVKNSGREITQESAVL